MNLRILKREPNPGTGDRSRVLFLLPSENEATAEDLAMLQALYSRDPRPIDDAIKLLKSSNSGDFMKKFYVGYGHESIADLGMVVVAIENVPMPVAKLIQHYQLYRGQECSTRYLDFSKQHFCSRTEEGKVYQEKLRSFYLSSMEPTTEHLLERFKLDRDKPGEFKAAKAAAFDVLRGYLPCGAVTNLAWTVDLRNLNDRIHALKVFVEDYPELGFVLDKLQSLFEEVFPNSVRKEYQDVNPLEWPFGKDLKHLWDSDAKFHPLRTVNGQQRGQIEWMGLLDFASWRDLARHRSVFQTFPLITTDHGWEWWYEDNLPNDLQSQGQEILHEATTIKNDVYAIPMAYQVPFFISGPLEKFRYIIRLRSGMTVHPTLRSRIIGLTEQLERTHGLEFKCNRSEDWIVGGKRGQQDITRVVESEGTKKEE